MNSVILTGRLTRDPEFKALENTSLCSFTLAVDMPKDKTVFVPCSVFGALADLMSKTLRKGSLIAVQGKLDQRTYETQAGEKRVATQVIVDTFDYLEKKEETTKEKIERTGTFTTNDLDALDLPDDDLPF